MTVAQLVEKLGLKIFTPNCAMDKTVKKGYCGDLLSWVMAHAQAGDAWITVHVHLNIVAVALLTDVSCIIIPEGIQVEDATISKAEKENIAILGSPMNAYEISWRLHEILS